MSSPITVGSTPASSGAGPRPPSVPSAAGDGQLQRLVDMLMAGRVQQAIYAAAALGVADRLADGPLSVKELAERTSAHPGALQRLLRLLAGYDIFVEDDQGRFALTPLASMLRSGTPLSLRPVALWCGSVAYKVFGEIEHTIRTGEPAFDRVFGAEFFEYLDEHPETGTLFDEFMARQTSAIAAVLPTAYPFEGIHTLVDVGGGRAQLLLPLLAAFPSMVGVLFDRPRVAAQARQAVAHSNLASRCRIVEGDIAASPLPPADAYLLKSMVHGVDDRTAIEWLRNCRRAMPSHARLLLIEMVMPEGNAPHPSRLMDLLMLLGTSGGRERTQTQFAELLQRAALHLAAVIPTRSPYTILEALPV